MSFKWRFPASNHGKSKGISTGDSETFRKAPYKSFAREILQNSVDAIAPNKKTVKVEFKTFDIETKKIPGYDEYRKSIENILSYWSHKADYVNIYNDVMKALDANSTTCLRISDYNTTGLRGVYSNDLESNKFLALAKGAGVSEKDGTLSGGSKGVGKNAAFELSKFKMVFYSTRTIDNEDGYLGVTELISGYVDGDNSEDRDHTQGTGFYSSDEYNNSIHQLINLDPNQKERNESGTDIYIIGFENDDGWEDEVINSLLDSFMASIVREELSIDFNGIEIDAKHVKDIIDSNHIYENNKANVYSQYKLLTGGDDVRVFDIETEFGTPKLYVWPVPNEKEEFATHECAMIRYPLMKIKSFPLNKSFNVSAMCIIEDDELGRQLLNIENPQHIDWEEKRIKDPNVRKAVRNAINEMREQINDYVIECLKLTDTNPIDPYGAGEFLPDSNLGDSKSKSNEPLQRDASQIVTISNKKESSSVERKQQHDTGDNYDGLMPDLGRNVDENTEEKSQRPGGHNEHQGGKSHPGDEDSGVEEGDNVIYKKVTLNGIKYKVISINKDNGEYRIIFTSPGNYSNCYLNISLVDDANNKYSVNILNLSCNGTIVECDDYLEYGPFEIFEGNKTKLDIKVDEKDYFASEVKIICK